MKNLRYYLIYDQLNSLWIKEKNGVKVKGFEDCDEAEKEAIVHTFDETMDFVFLVDINFKFCRIFKSKSKEEYIIKRDLEAIKTLLSTEIDQDVEIKTLSNIRDHLDEFKYLLFNPN